MFASLCICITHFYFYLMQKLLTLHNWVLLPNDNVSMSVGHLDHILLTVYSSMEHVTRKSPGPICGWVGRILHPCSCISQSSWSKVPLFIHLVCHCASLSTTLPCPSRWHGSLPRHGLWWLTCELHCSPLPWRLRWFPGHVLHRAVNSQQEIIKMSNGHQTVVNR